jgi:alpha-tubulin suppressor-like RCC1 family protein
VGAGYASTAAIKTDNTLWIWGRNNIGQLGDNTVVNRSSPVQIGALTNWSSVALGVDSAAAIKTDGTLWAWGRNNGQVGDGTITNRSSPVQIGALTNWSQVAASRYNGAAIKAGGTLWVWGGNARGQLGNGVAGGGIALSSPVQIGALTNWAQIAMSVTGEASAAVKTDGTLWSWGFNTSGQLGQNDATSRSSPVQIGALTNWFQISSGDENFSAIKTDGTLWGWGDNGFGRLGDGTTTNRSSPVQIGALTNWFRVSPSKDNNGSTLAITKG